MSPLKAFKDGTTILCSKETDQQNTGSVRCPYELGQNVFQPEEISKSVHKERRVRPRCLLQNSQSRYTKDRSRACQEPRKIDTK
ncbi:hypothetical protein PoB_003861100 [Plakobranchus ocellatus]|uniref:Uncharacterized protein n=1 Tax=Plakobranchus ocellatus TaxID=259542 RepID=A0AAV4AZX2_9GAST|nr:hypothetical protein PoB_003861100 [Plakobranchus ocellatus]